MTKGKIELLAWQIMQQQHNDKRGAVAVLVAAVDSLFALGKFEQSRQAQKVLDFVRANY
ncbi:MAG: hypothetical protein J6S67_25985 [Methanobrevibacter sp.]|nr:hypothetical protein [Methanobrevibacter sp.]